MSTPDQPTPTTQPELPEWTQEDADAMFASVVWFDWKAPPELLKQYEGMHVAILSEEIIDADRDLNALGRRLDAKGSELPNRVVIKYVYTPEDDLNFGSRVGSWPESDCT
jgi:hypothetical protein